MTKTFLHSGEKKIIVVSGGAVVHNPERMAEKIFWPMQLQGPKGALK